MKNDKININHTSSMGFCEWLTLLFIGLKLTNVITWSWLMVLAPIWIPICIVLVLIIVTFFIMAFSETARTKFTKYVDNLE